MGEILKDEISGIVQRPLVHSGDRKSGYLNSHKYALIIVEISSRSTDSDHSAAKILAIRSAAFPSHKSGHLPHL